MSANDGAGIPPPSHASRGARARPGARMPRRAFLAAGLVAALARRPLSAASRSRARVGYLDQLGKSDGERLYRDFVDGLEEQGYVVGRNLQIVRRSAGGDPERLRNLAAEMAAEPVDVILATTAQAARSAKVGAPGIATVFVISSDPVIEGLVASLSRPQGRLTGLVTRGEDLTAKRLQLLKEAFPAIRTVAVVGSNIGISRVAFDDAARRLQVDVLTFPVNRYDDYREAAAAISRSPADALLVVEDVNEVAGLHAFVRLMMATRRPVMFNADVFVEEEAFGLMAYGVSLRQQYRRAAAIVAKVLDGANPADIPVEQPTRYELVVNLRAAEEYRLALPRGFVLRADRVIR